MDVGFRLKLIKDPAAKNTLRQWERDLLASQKRVDKSRLDSARKFQKDVVSLERSTGKRTTDLKRAALNKQEIIQKQSIARVVKAESDHLSRFRKMESEKRRELRRTGSEAEKQSKRGGAPTGVGGRGVGGRRSPAGGAAGGVSQGLIGGLMARGGSMLMRGGPAVAAIGTAWKGYSFANESIDTFIKSKDTLIRMEALTGSAKEAKAAIVELRQTSMISGIQQQTLEKGVQTMLGFGVSLDSAKKKVREFGAIAAGDGMKVERLSLAFAQAEANGRLMAEELNQMIDAGFNPLREISRQTGKSILQLRDEMRDGQISIEMLENAFTGATSAGGQFGTMYEKMSQSTTVAIGQMEAEYAALQRRVGETLQPLFDLTIDVKSLTIRATNAALDNLEGGRADEKRKDLASQMSDKKLDELHATLKKQTERTSNTGPNAPVGDMGWGAAIMETIGLPSNAVNQRRGFGVVLSEKLKRIQEGHAKVEEERKAADEKKKAEQDLFKQKQMNALTLQAKELTSAKHIASIREKAMDKELAGRQKALNIAQKAQDVAEKALLTARERFGAMSEEEQSDAVKLIVKARKTAPRKLDLESIAALQKLGTSEANRIASQALVARSQAGFGLDMTNPKARQQARLRQSLFAEETNAVRQAQRETVKIDASVKQQVQYIAKFDQTAAELAGKVADLNQKALDKQMDDVLKLLAPIIKKQQDERTRSQSNVPGRF